MFADDMKVWETLSCKEDSKKLQEDLDSLDGWSRWALKFNAGKCKVMHIGHDFPTEYFMGGDEGIKVKLEEIVIEKDLGVNITNDLKPSEQCSKEARKAISVLPMVKRHVKRLDKQDFLLIYKTYIRPHMEYCVQAWSPHLAKDIQTLERVQRCATKLIPSIKKLSYEIRLKKLDLTSLERRRTIGDLFETFKILKGMENIDKEQFFEISDTGHNLRGHNMTLAVNRSRLDTRKFFFNNRVVCHWNDLTQEIVDATSVNSFKNRLDKHWSRDMGTLRILSSPPITFFSAHNLTSNK